METRKSSRKTRSYGGTPKSSRNSQSSLVPIPGEGRSQCKERVNSAPLAVLRSEEQQQHRHRQHTSTSRLRTESQNYEPDPRASYSPSSPIVKQSAVPLQRYSASSQAGGSGEIQEVALAVLGAAAVGKSTFVHCALDLKRTSTLPFSSKKVSLEGKISVVRLLELGFDDVKVTADQGVCWPEKIGDQNMPEIDGVLALYDVMNQDSISQIPGLLEALSKDAIPTVLVSAKCDNPPQSWEVDHYKIEEFCNSVKVESFSTSASAPETHKRCISVILRNIMLERRGAKEEAHSLRPRATTSTDLTGASSSLHSSQAESKHGRAASEVSDTLHRRSEMANSIFPSPSTITSEFPRIQNSTSCRSPRRRSEEFSHGRKSPDMRRPSKGSNDESTTNNQGCKVPCVEDLNNRFELQISSQPSNSSGPSATAIASSCYTQDDIMDGILDTESIDSAKVRRMRREEDGGKESGTPFEDLVDRLLSQPLSKSDSKFAAIFLCLYRKFAAPSTLISAIIRRFEDVNDRDIPYLTRLTSQLRYLGILRDWVSDYPGDFAHPLTRRTVTVFVQGLTVFQEFAVASKEISPHLDVVSEDDDTEWACSDKRRSRANTMESFLTMSSAHSTASTLNAASPTLTADSSTEDIVDSVSPENGVKSQPNRVSAAPSSTSSIARSESKFTGSYQTLLNTIENSQRQAQLLTPMSRNVLNKVQWHQMMEIPEEHIARELTRIDWIMYSSIRPRDLVRHVSLTLEQKEKCKSLEHVNRMIHQFNHIAFWVANMILLRDKPKHRAKALEKFMGVAWKLRYLNNYNSLGAVVAGINGTAVHRLAQTRELIPPQSQKQFMRLEILMGTQKSHAAYRLAWANTSTQRIPFLPLHRRDLVFAEEGNPTYVTGREGERINWKKFEIMGEVIIGIKKSQEVAYSKISRNEEVQRLVLDGDFSKDDDELYERSKQLEGPGNGENSRKRFNWFQR